jgi:hypothetical protein
MGLQEEFLETWQTISGFGYINREISILQAVGRQLAITLLLYCD